jgi:hypothetical protein
MWAGMTEGQGAVLAAIITVLGAAIGVVIGAKLFSGRVAKLEDAVEHSEKCVEEYLQTISAKISDLDLVIATISGGLQKLKSDIEESADEGANSAQREGQASPDIDVREFWRAVRDKIEDAASNSEIDGRTRAKYGRVDRRSYYDLIEKMEWDGWLENAGLYREAYQIWLKYKNGKKSITRDDRARMQALSGVLI